MFISIAIFFIALILFYFWACSRVWPEDQESQIKKLKDSHSKASQKLKIGTYNFGYASGKKNLEGSVLSKSEIIDNLEAAVEYLKQEDLDILCLQEIDLDAHRSHRIDQLDYLAQRLNFNYIAYTLNWNHNYIPWPYWPPKKHFKHIVSGQSILSKYPIEKQEILTYPAPQSRLFFQRPFYLKRKIQKAKIKYCEEEISVWNLHLEAFDEKTRQVQIDDIQKNTAIQKESKLIIAGDFNTDIQRESKDAKKVSKELATFPSWQVETQIDHILVSDNLKIEKQHVISDLFSSDHLALVAEIKMD